MKLSIYLNRRVFVMIEYNLSTTPIDIIFYDCGSSRISSLLFLGLIIAGQNNYPVSILHKSIAGRYRPVRVADGPITSRYKFIKNASLYCDIITIATIAKSTIALVLLLQVLIAIILR